MGLVKNNQVPEAMKLVCALGLALGVAPLNKRSGCWEERIDEQWEIAVNGHRTPMRCSHDCDVPPFSVYVQYNGWPAGIIDPSGGVIAAGVCANEDTFIAALNRRLSEIRRP